MPSDPLTVVANFAPDNSPTSFNGHATITKTTLTVFAAERHGSTPNTAPKDSATNERAVFVGVCSLPLIQFYRHRNVVTFLRGSSFLFDNAATSIGAPSATATSRTDAAIRNESRSRRDNPSMWESLAMRCASVQDCDRVVEELATRNAEEVLVPPFPVHTQDRHSRNGSTPTSLNSLHLDAHDRGARESEAGREPRQHSRRGSPSIDSHRPVSSHISERPQRHDSAQRTSVSVPTPQLNGSSPGSSRLPSRRESDDAASYTSRRREEEGSQTSRVSRPRSQRANEDAEPTATPTSSIRAARLHVAPGRIGTTGHTPSRRDAEQPSAQNRRPSSEHGRRAVDTAAADAPHGRLQSSVHRRLVAPIEREFEPAVPEAPPRSHSRPHRRHDSPSSASAVSPHRSHHHHHHHRSRHQHDSPSEDEASSQARRDATPHNARASSRAATPLAPASGRRVYAERNGTDHRESASPRSQTSYSGRSEQGAFLRCVQRLYHHRLHFMQYLHKEMVHQAYLVEEARVMATAKVTASHRRTNSPAGAGRAPEAMPAMEVARLQEVERRLTQVEALHREAEREREEAARLRREYEWKIEELNARIGGGPGPRGLPNGSREVSEPNSSVLTPLRNSIYTANGQLMVVPPPGGRGTYNPFAAQQWLAPAEVALAADPVAAPRRDDADLSVAILDRYVFGEEWHRLYPAYEADVRFNAQVDVCLALKLPRRLVTITNVVVDRPGLRVTAEIRYDHVKMEREGLERRVNGCPFRFLQRFYDLRDVYDSHGVNPAALMPSKVPKAIAPPSSMKGSRRASTTKLRRPSQLNSLRSPRAGSRVHGINSDVSDLSGALDSGDDGGNSSSRRRQFRLASEERVDEQRRRWATEVFLQAAHSMAQLVEREGYLRGGIELAEAKERQRVGYAPRARMALASSLAKVEAEERVSRAAIVAGAARQLHVLMGGHRGTLAVLSLRASEAERRRHVALLEEQERYDLNRAVNPAFSAQRRKAERQAHKEEVLVGRGADRFGKLGMQAALADLQAEETAARAIVRSKAMEALLDLLFHTPTPKLQSGGRAPSHAPATVKAFLQDLQAAEAAARGQLMADERYRRRLYRREAILRREALKRVGLEMAELDARDAILEDMMSLNRHQLERRLRDREELINLLSEEHFYRQTVLSDEQDAFEVIAELFSTGFTELLRRVPDVSEDDNDEEARRRRVSTTRQAKAFHYMTFTPDDMDYPPSAVLAIEGVLGCAINKNLEVVSVARPLPKAEDDEEGLLQLQARDMILDVAGHSLHSLSHLREVISNRVMQIQEEAFAEFPDVPHDALATNPALQKYLEMLCEHHNFLVQVLRGCDIYQIIVRS